MADYGIKISQPGFNALTCQDYELIFNSSWPTLSIAFDKTLSVTTDSFGQVTTTIPHNLGFFPLNMAWQFSDSTLTKTVGRFFPNMDKNNLYLYESSLASTSGVLSANTTYYINVKCYNLDISQPQSYLYLQPPAVNFPYDDKYGIKVVKQNENIDSNDLRSFILHSRAASPQVLSVITEKSPLVNNSGNNNGTLQFVNPQGYTPWAFGYAYQLIGGNNAYVWAPPTSQAYPRIFFGKGDIPNYPNVDIALPLQNSPPNTPQVGSVIVLRDPLFVANYTQVTY